MEGGEKNDFMSEQDFLASSYPSDGSHGSRGKGPNGKKVLVLGGTAFIGRTVVGKWKGGKSCLLCVSSRTDRLIWTDRKIGRDR